MADTNDANSGEHFGLTPVDCGFNPKGATPEPPSVSCGFNPRIGKPKGKQPAPGQGDNEEDGREQADRAGEEPALP